MNDSELAAMRTNKQSLFFAFVIYFIFFSVNVTEALVNGQCFKRL